MIISIPQSPLLHILSCALHCAFYFRLRSMLFVCEQSVSFLTPGVMSKPPPVHRLLHIMTIKANVEAVLQALFPFKHAFPIVLLTHAVMGSSYVLRCLFCFPLSYYQTLIWSYFLRWRLAVESYRVDNKVEGYVRKFFYVAYAGQKWTL